MATRRRYERVREVLSRRQPDLTVLMENVSKPHNLSAILRSADAVGVLEAHAVNPTGGVPTHHHTAAGAERWVYLKVHPDIRTAAEHLKSRGFTLVATRLSDKAKDYREVDYTQPVALILGSEKWGVSEEAAELADLEVVIPMLGMAQSLNVSVAAAVILFEAQRQRLAAGMYDRVRLDEKTFKRVLFEWLYPELARELRQRGEPYPELDEEGRPIWSSSS